MIAFTMDALLPLCIGLLINLSVLLLLIGAPIAICIDVIRFKKGSIRCISYESHGSRWPGAALIMLILFTLCLDGHLSSVLVSMLKGRPEFL